MASPPFFVFFFVCNGVASQTSPLRTQTEAGLMPKKFHNALNPKTVATLSRPGLYADGGGLALKIDRRGNRCWVVRLKVEGRMTTRGIGRYPAVTLADARKAAVVLVQDVKAEEAAADALSLEAARQIPTFAEAAERMIDSRRPTWSNEKHAAQWASTLQTYAYPVVGGKPVDEITTADVMRVLEPIWAVKPETASRVRQRIEAVLDYCAVYGWRSMDNAAGRQLLKVLEALACGRVAKIG